MNYILISFIKYDLSYVHSYTSILKKFFLLLQLLQPFLLFLFGIPLLPMSKIYINLYINL